MHYVIGDIHGYFDEFMALVEKIEKKDRDPHFILTGDLIDRGPDVLKTVYWAMENVGEGKRFESILGNHEDMILKWYKESYLPVVTKEFTTLGRSIALKRRKKPRYDFMDRLKEAGILYDDKKVGEIMDFFASLPDTKKITVTAANGKPVTYGIAHGFYLDPQRLSVLSADELHHFYIWNRSCTGEGYDGDDMIVVHGHTPTVERECELEYYYDKDEEPINPGLIAYRRNVINVDGGRPYMDFEKRFCTICGICLETLEEFFAVDPPEDYKYVENCYYREMYRKLHE